jgi:hypothetical protein
MSFSGPRRLANILFATSVLLFESAQASSAHDVLEHDVKRLLLAMIARLTGVQVTFDVIPAWFSRNTLSGLGYGKIHSYTAARMPWGVSMTSVESTLRGWSDRVREVSVTPYGLACGGRALVLRVFAALPGLRNVPPCIVRVYT